jgi:hypothetical protein
MKKITLLLLLSLTAFSLQAQNFYNFSTSQQTYADLENSTSINNGEVWFYDQFSEITIPFPFKIAGQTVDRFLFDDDFFAFLTTGTDYATDDTGIFSLYPSAAIYISDRTYSTNISTSPISYKIEGEAGNRILKLEVKNAGIENATEIGFPENEFFVNNQLWLYEADNAIEFRFGDHNITDFAVVADDPGERFLAAFIQDDAKMYVVYGQSSAPSYGEFTEETIPATLNTDLHPSSGTVYRLVPDVISGLEDFAAAEVKLYPNPATSVLHIQSDNITATEYAIYNVVGKLVIQNKINDSNDVQINIQNLESGLYFVKINNQYLKFIKQ